MGREVRMVPPDWAHPIRGDGRYKPLFTGYSKTLEERAKWREGFAPDYDQGGYKPKDADQLRYTEEDYFGELDASAYMPEWPAEVATHFMMYENTTEGTPISPAFATPEELARWLADTGASAFGHDTASYESWLRTIRRGCAPSAVIAGGQIMSGVEAMGR